jgi:PIN domain nuclease of toxin-antitoxin system
MTTKNMFLIDTHILLWWATENTKLSKKNKAIIDSPHNTIIVSAATIWELTIKKNKGLLTIPDDLMERLFEANIQVLPITAQHALFIENLPVIHNDPFDRMLIAQSIIEGATLITADKNIHHYKVDGFKLL